MMREYHVRFCEQLWVKFLGLTRPYFKDLLLNGSKHRLMHSVIPAKAGIQYKTIPFSGILCVYASVRTKFVGLF